MAVHIPAVLAVLVYFIVVVCVGVWSGRKLHVIKEEGPMSAMREDMRRRRPQPPKRFLHRLFLADRSMSLGLGISTMTATWVGGGYLNGTAEAVYTHGVLYCHVPIGYAISLVLGDAAGSMMEVDSKLFIVIAATTIFFYTALGGQYSVAYTDVLQICITIVFMWVCVPYVMKGRAVGTVRGPETDWIGDVSFSEAGPLLDAFLMTALGGIPWQVYFQCILGSNSDFAAEVLSYVSALGCVVMAVPPIVIGATAKTTTVMSSADSSMFSASTMVTKNVYYGLLRPSASETEVALTLRIMVCLFGAVATYLALSVQSVFGLWTLCSEVVYVLLFPQLVCVFYIKNTNTYGSVTVVASEIARSAQISKATVHSGARSLAAFVLGAFVRWLCGEPSLNVSASIQLPLYDQKKEPWFPFRLACMSIGFVALIGGSSAAAMAFEKRWLPPHYDVFGCFREPQPGETATRRTDTLWTRVRSQ
ncbi:hypothetical protein HPB52_013918 [Rhipicephalus sanguineus]|uniref:High-affinity choline transporter 1 n=1 Tax=Rhipicephalus sanguineus TaxID=34632 RepID=A0A9D4PWI0_RHISA|nr:hypothetical protein HPB52_013918 [Rhipicephalus sanguineus]